MFYFFDELPSTIDEARDPKYRHGDVILAENQTAGRGQRGKKWSSEAGANLMLSAVLDTGFLRTAEQFALLQAVALALVDTLGGWGLDARIKWANDIYVGDRKIVGMLIDHTSAEGMLRRSGAGIGLNVNQTTFDPCLPNPTSMALELGRNVDRREVLDKFHRCLMARYDRLKKGAGESVADEYHSLIYRLGVPTKFVLAAGGELTGTIRGVAPDGALLVEDGTGLRSFLFHEVSMVI